MIASVRGEVLVRRPDHVVIESGGVGYRLTVSAETLKAVPAGGKQATLHATWSSATTRCSSTASPPRRSATCSCI